MPGHHQEKGAATARHSHHPREAISVVASTHCIPTSLSQGVKPAGDAALVPRPLHCHTVIAEGTLFIQPRPGKHNHDDGHRAHCPRQA